MGVLLEVTLDEFQILVPDGVPLFMLLLRE